MKNQLLSLPFLMVTASHAEECSCNIYPFVPNPPCFKLCISNLVKNKEIDLSKIKDLDPEVAVNISILRHREVFSAGRIPKWDDNYG